LFTCFYLFYLGYRGCSVLSSRPSRVREEFLRLLREDREFRYTVLGLLGFEEILGRLDENTRAIRSLQEQVSEHSRAIKSLQEQVAENTRAIRSLQEQVVELQKIVVEHSRAIKSLQEQVAENTRAIRSLQEQVAENTRAIRSLQEQVAELQKIVVEHSRAIEKMASSIQAIGNRYGLFTEEAFREGIKYVIADLLREYRVDKWVYYDKKGVVYGYPSVVEVDVLVKDREYILVEYKSSVDRGDVAELYRVGKLFEEEEGVKPKLLIVSPSIRRRARELAEKLGVEVRGVLVEV